MAYENGRYPLSMFVHRGDNIYLTPSLNARWNEAVRLALEKYGVRLYITGDIDGLGGWNGYRPYDAQVRYKKFYGNMAAAAGYSSHGGIYGGKEVFAADIANWKDLAPGNATLAWSRFVAIMKIVGLTTDFVSPREQWHVGDFNYPWSVPSFAAVEIKPETTNRPDPEEEDEMPKNVTQYYKTGKNTYVYIAYNTGSGFWHVFGQGPEAGTMPGDYTAKFALTFGSSGWSEITEGHAKVIEAACALVRAGK